MARFGRSRCSGKPAKLSSPDVFRDIAAITDRIRSHFDDGCFVCGRENPIGLQIDAFAMSDDGQVSASFVPRADYRGTQAVLHGGVSAAALDEIMVWAGILVDGVVTVTGTFDLRYRRPVGVEGRIDLTGRVDERRGRRLRLSGELHYDDAVAVEATGLYLVSEEVAELVDLA